MNSFRNSGHDTLSNHLSERAEGGDFGNDVPDRKVVTKITSMDIVLWYINVTSIMVVAIGVRGSARWHPTTMPFVATGHLR